QYSWTNVVRVDLLTHSILFIGVQGQRSTDRAHGFGQHHRDHTVENAGGLQHPVIDGDGGFYSVVTDAAEFDPEDFDYRTFVQRSDVVQGRLTKPNAHEFFLLNRTMV